MIKFFANKVELKNVPVTQNENGVYYSNGSAYFKPKLADFDKATLPKGYKRYINGSHVGDKNKPIDFSINADVKIVADQEVKLNRIITLKGYKKPWAIELIHGDKHILLGHVKTTRKVGDRIKAGEVICSIQTVSENGQSAPKDGGKAVPPHLHAGTFTENKKWTQITFRQIVLAVNENKPITEMPIIELKDKERERINELEKANQALEDMVVTRDGTITQLQSQLNLCQQALQDVKTQKEEAIKEAQTWKDYVDSFERDNVKTAFIIILKWVKAFLTGKLKKTTIKT